MASNHGKTTHEFQGNKALTRAKGVLQSYDLDGQVDRIYVEIEETYSDQKGDSSQKSSSQNQSKGPKDERSFREIRRDTNHHKVLYAISKMDDKELPASASEISDELKNVPSTSTFASLSDLYKRRLVDRERITGVDNPYYVYEVSHYGKAELDRLREPS